MFTDPQSGLRFLVSQTKTRFHSWSAQYMLILPVDKKCLKGCKKCVMWIHNLHEDVRRVSWYHDIKSPARGWSVKRCYIALIFAITWYLLYPLIKFPILRLLIWMICNIFCPGKHQLIGIAMGGAWCHLEQNQIGLKRKPGICLEKKVGEARVVAVA